MTSDFYPVMQRASGNSFQEPPWPPAEEQWLLWDRQVTVVQMCSQATISYQETLSVFFFNNTNFKQLSQCLKMLETLIVLGSMMGDLHLFKF